MKSFHPELCECISVQRLVQINIPLEMGNANPNKFKQPNNQIIIIIIIIMDHHHQ